MFHLRSWLGDGGSDSDDDEVVDHGCTDSEVDRITDEFFTMWHSMFEDSSGSGSDVENYECIAAAKALWDAEEDEYDDWEPNGWISGGPDDEHFDRGVANVEVPISLVTAGRGVGREGVQSNPYLMLYLVGEELSDIDDGQRRTSRARPMVHRSARQALPHEVVEAVLLRLPAAAQARCRAVCKAWLSMLSSPEFYRRNFVESLARMTAPLCAVEYDDGQDVLPSNHLRAPMYKSLKLDLSFLPEVFHSIYTEMHSCSPSGLLCLGCSVDEGMLVCVLNPVNQCFKVLPLLEKRCGNAILTAETTAATDILPSFEVYVSIDVRDRKEVAIYKSVTGEWKGFVSRPSLARHRIDWERPDEEGTSLPMACNGAIYTLVCCHRPRLVRLSTDGGPRYLWDVVLPYFDKHGDREWMDECFLVDYRGRLLCCCGGIWMLDNVKQAWIPIANRCPPEILPPCNPRKKHTLTLEKVQVAGDLVVFFHQVEIRRGRSGTQEVCPVAFDMLRKRWRKVPKGIAKVGDLFQAMPNLKF